MSKSDRYKRMMEDSRDGFLVVDSKGNLLESNQAYADMSGYSVTELAKMNFRSLAGTDDELELKSRLRKLLALGYDRYESQHRHKAGHFFEVDVSINFIRESKRFFVHFRDLSERRLHEQELREREEKYRGLFENAGDLAYGIDLNLNFTAVSDSLLRISGYRRDELINASISKVLKSESLDLARRMAAAKLNAEKQVTRYELEMTDKEGRQIPLELVSTLIYKNGQAVGVQGIGRDISERKAAEEKIQQLVFHDPLTHLPNRRLLLDRLQQAFASCSRTGRKGALLFIDLDNFKTLNDTLGHLKGDMLLKHVAERLTSCIREGDTVARLGGDEFVVMLENLETQAIEAARQTESVGENILRALNQPYELAEQIFHCSASIGATLIDENTQGAEELLKQADIAMYQSKRAGRNALRFFDQKMQDTITARVILEGELHRALEEQHFQLHYQIQMDKFRQALGAEALIRWVHPTHGLISATQFVPLAEETGLILHIGQWVLESACIQLKRWALNEHTRNLILAVNVSAKQFHQPDFVAQVRAAVQRHDIDPRLLKLELTESLLLEDSAATILTMNELKEFGIKLSLDDFGTGYSSLQYLKKLPLYEIKIAQSFVNDLAHDSNDAAIVQTIIAMAGTLGLGVIAEGVETAEQHEFLDSSGCDVYQGHLFGKPMPIEQFDAQLHLN
ncbi:MAG TPA: EAL domain-containing protein [Gallionella sp.]